MMIREAINLDYCCCNVDGGARELSAVIAVCLNESVHDVDLGARSGRV